MNYITPSLIRDIMKQAEAQDSDYVSILKPTLRSVLFELLRFLEVQTPIDRQRAEKIQGLTLEFACLYIANMLRDISKDGDDDGRVCAMLGYVESEVRKLATNTGIMMEGQA